MKNPRPALLVVSLLANAALGAWWLFSPSPQPSSHQFSPSTEAMTGELSRPEVAPVQATWGDFSQGSAASYAASLRQQNFPLWAVHALIEARVRASFAPQLAALETEKIPWWRRTRERFSIYDDIPPEARAVRREVENAIREEIDAAVGEPYRDPYRALYGEQRYGMLPAASAAQAEAIDRDYEELQTQLRELTAGYSFPADREQFRLLEAEKRRDLADTLTPEQLLEYDLRNSNAAMFTRHVVMRWLEGSEAEFRAITARRMAFDSQWAFTPSDKMKEYIAADEAFNASLRDVLPPDRFALYEIVTAPSLNFSATATLLSEFNYDTATAVSAVEVQRAIQVRAESIRKNEQLARAQRNAELRALYQEARSQLSVHLSPAALAALEQANAGQWLKRLNVTTAPAKGGP